MTHNYVLVETVALVQRRLGMAAVGDLRDALLPVLALDWVDRELHERAAAAYVAAGRRDLSFVDHVSFELMRATAIPAAFAFDADFARVGFELLPAR